MKTTDIIQKNLDVYHASRGVLLSGRPFYNEMAAQDFLSHINDFEGWGRCRKLIDPNSDEYAYAYKEIEDYAIKKSDTLRLMRDIQSATLTSFYTPTDVAQTITEYALQAYNQLNGRPARTLLDPSCGTGAFLTGLESNKELVEVVACEKDEITRTILKAKAIALGFVHHNPFRCLDSYQEVHPVSSVDIITSNIPFGDVQVYDTNFQKYCSLHGAMKRIHNYYFMKSMHLLNDGGIMAFITSRGFIASPKNEVFVTELMKHGNLLETLRLPDNLFRTVDVGSDLIIFRKNEQDPDIKKFPLGWSACVASEEMECKHIPNCEVTRKKNQYGKLVYYYKYIGTDLAADLKWVMGSDPLTHKDWVKGSDPVTHAIHYANHFFFFFDKFENEK